MCANAIEVSRGFLLTDVNIYLNKQSTSYSLPPSLLPSQPGRNDFNQAAQDASQCVSFSS